MNSTSSLTSVGCLYDLRIILFARDVVNYLLYLLESCCGGEFSPYQATHTRELRILNSVKMKIPPVTYYCNHSCACVIDRKMSSCRTL